MIHLRETSGPDNQNSFPEKWMDYPDEFDSSPEKQKKKFPFQPNVELFGTNGHVNFYRGTGGHLQYLRLKKKYGRKINPSDFFKMGSSAEEKIIGFEKRGSYGETRLGKREMPVFEEFTATYIERAHSVSASNKSGKVEKSDSISEIEETFDGLKMDFENGGYVAQHKKADNNILNGESFIHKKIKEFEAGKQKQIQKRKTVPKKGRGPASLTRICKTEDLVEFRLLKHLIQKFHLKQEIFEEEFEELHSAERRLFLLLLKKHFRESQDGNELTYPVLQDFSRKFTKKRNEEKIKQIWKRFLKSVYEKTKRKEYRCIRKDTGGKRLRDKWRDFYQLIFKDLIGTGKDQYHIDLVMDICSEKTVGVMKSKAPLTHENNWKTNSKVAAMKKIPASFRFLVSLLPGLAAEFEEYVDPLSANGIVFNMKKIISSKLEKLFMTWQLKFKEVNRSSSLFLAWIESEIKNPKFKLPWLIQDIEKAAKYCTRDFRNEKLKKEFREISSVHYSNQQKGDHQV